MSAPAWLNEWQARAGNRWWWPLAGALVVLAGIIWIAARSGSGAPPAVADTEAHSSPAASHPAETTAPASPAMPAPPTPGATPAALAPPATHDGSAAPSAAPSPTVKIVFRTFPSRVRAVVMWGGKRLGFIDRNAPLVIERPRDSGPLDVVIRATGYLPVHTRVYTFNDSNIDVKITQVDKKDTIYGYKEPLPPDAGAPFPSDAPELE